MTILAPVVPDTIIQFVGQQVPHVTPSAAETVAVPIVSDWGPVGANPPGTDGLQGGIQLCTSFADYLRRYGDSDTPGRTAVAEAFTGSGLPGALGAGGVLAYRLAGSSAAKATSTINETGGSTAGLRLDAKYPGTRGNRISWITDVDPSNAARDRLRILFDAVLKETYLYANTDIAGLLVSINARSSLVSATNLEASAIQLAHGTGSLTGGNDGATLAGADHLAAQTALEFAPYSLLSFFDLTPNGDSTDATNLASWLSWLRAQVAANRPAIMVVGGAPGETVDSAITRAGTLNEPHVVNLGVGTYHDDLLDKDLSTSQLAPRIAGILAARGRSKSATHALLGGLHVVGQTGPASDEVQSAIQGGVTCFKNAESPDAELHVAKAVTSFTTDGVAGQPLDVFGDPRLIRIMDLYVRDIRAWGNAQVIGNLPVNDDTRAALRGEARKLQDELLRGGLIEPGDATANPPVPAPYVNVPVTHDDTLPYTFGWQFTRTANAILGEGTVF